MDNNNNNNNNNDNNNNDKKKQDEDAEALEGTATSVAPVELQGLEDSATVKQNSYAAAAGDGEDALARRNDRIAVKNAQQAQSGDQKMPAASSVAPVELQGLEDSATIKQNSYAAAAGDGEDALARRNDRIAAKNAQQAQSGDRKMPPASAATMAGATMVGAGGFAAAEKIKAAPAENGFAQKASIDNVPEKAPEKGIQDGGVAGGDGYDAGYGHGGSLLADDFEYVIHDDVDNLDGLEIAMPVEEDDENAFIPSAIEYDPDAKPPMYRNRRFRLYAFLAFFVLVLAAVGVGVGITVGKDDDQQPRHAGQREKLGIKELLERVVGADVLEDQNSAYSKALKWITYVDPMELTPDDPSFLQRYVAAYFYEATSVERSWQSCNPPDPLLAHEDASCTYDKPILFHPVIKRIPIVGYTRWLSEKPECEWVGMLCDKFSQVRAIDLSKWTLGTLMVLFSVICLTFLCALQLRWYEYDWELP
jgi:hypothetical protein